MANTIVKNIAISGKTITVTKIDGTTGTFTQQDNNTTYTAGTNMRLSGTTFSTSAAPSFTNVTVNNAAANGLVIGTYHIYVG